MAPHWLYNVKKKGLHKGHNSQITDDICLSSAPTDPLRKTMTGQQIF
jgi:hypothetical protein